MKKIINLYIVYFVLLSVIQGQEKGDYNWLVGYKSIDTLTDRASKIDFNFNPPILSTESIPINFDITNASYSDNNGELVLYTNGITIVNGEHQIIENGERITPGANATSWEFFGHNVPQGIIILPLPDTSNIYVLIYMEIEYFGGQIGYAGVNLYQSIVNMNENNGLGKVIEKDILIVSDTLELGQITATKHANGQDWWVIVHKDNSEYFYKMLLSSNGLREAQLIETEISARSGLGQSTFSPNGEIYTRINLVTPNPDWIEIYHFDRCEGLLTFHTQIPLEDNAAFGGIAISPNSRFLYASYYRKIIQYDLFEQNIESSADTVAIWDGFESPNVTRFFLAQLAPDGKIYINSFNITNVLHIIHSPNEKGDSCNVEQHGLQLPTNNRASLPNFPNYRLGALEGSPCDTLISSTPTIAPAATQVTIYPNPAIHSVRLQWSNPPKGVVVWRLYNAFGQLVQEQNLQETKETEIAVGDLAKGMYFYSLEQEDKVLKGGKLIIQK